MRQSLQQAEREEDEATVGQSFRTFETVLNFVNSLGSSYCATTGSKMSVFRAIQIASNVGDTPIENWAASGALFVPERRGRCCRLSRASRRRAGRPSRSRRSAPLESFGVWAEDPKTKTYFFFESEVKTVTNDVVFKAPAGDRAKAL